MVAGYVGDQLALARGEAEEVGVADQVVGVLVVAGVIDEIADVVQQRGGLQKSHLPVGQAVTWRKGLEDLQGELGNLPGVPFVEMAGVGEFDGGIAPGAGGFVSGQQVLLAQSAQYQAFPDAALVDSQHVHLEIIHQLIHDGDPGDDDVGAVRVQAG